MNIFLDTIDGHIPLIAGKMVSGTILDGGLRIAAIVMPIKPAVQMQHPTSNKHPGMT